MNVKFIYHDSERAIVDVRKAALSGCREIECHFDHDAGQMVVEVRKTKAEKPRGGEGAS